MAITYTYTSGATTNLQRLRFFIGDNRGVNGTYADNAAWILNSKALFTDEELNDCLTLCAAETNLILSAARLAMVNRINREAMAAGVAGTTDTSDRPSALATAVHEMERISYHGQLTLPVKKTTTASSLDQDDLSP